MRWAALLHDAAKPQTRGVLPGGRVTFIGHDVAGAQARPRRARPPARLDRGCATTSPRSRRTTSTPASSSTERPLDRRTIWRYLRATQPYSADITLFTVADRLATRGRNADAAIAAHLEVARELLAAAREEDAAGPPRRWCAATS